MLHTIINHAYVIVFHIIRITCSCNVCHVSMGMCASLFHVDHGCALGLYIYIRCCGLRTARR